MNQEQIARTLSKHQPICEDVDEIPEGYIGCDSVDCGFMVEAGEWYDWLDAFAAHQASVLAPLIAAAKAEALREAAAEMARLWLIGKKPYAECSKDELLDYNPYVHMRPEVWLRARAAAMDPEGRALVEAIHTRKAQG